ncbi:MAG: phytanoyl-CoA dioxygenase family protein [Candidatus Latescibacteria bacterium]|jgi:ectoine hydroxylase-related dioxygenase (phytanoyl-CoA dioxygenase family)|nr:phytanoyl-CoA dioxygenase family protein [Candidatus Latescibacterota bacterium]
MTPEEKFMFDLEGYLVIRNALDAEELKTLNAAVDRAHPRDYDDEDADTKSGNGRGVRGSTGRVSNWDISCQKLIDHPNTLPYLMAVLGPKFRLDHDYGVFMMKGGKRGSLHGGAPDRIHHYYRYRDGEMQCGISVLVYCLADADAGAGGFCCIPGSHKTNFRMDIPREVRRLERVPNYVVQSPAKAGDAILFTEALVHGTMGWTADHERRALLYKYTPGFMVASPKHYDLSSYVNLTEPQKRILSPASVHDREDVLA